MQLRNFIIIILLIVFLNPYDRASSQDKGFKWSPGEELIFNVSWTFINLGTIKLQVFETDSKNKTKQYYSRMFVDSNPLLFFVNMHSIFETYVDENFRPTLHQAYENIDDVNYITQHYFNYEDSIITLKMTSVKDSTKVIQRNYPLVDKYYDALTLV